MDVFEGMESGNEGGNAGRETGLHSQDNTDTAAYTATDGSGEPGAPEIGLEAGFGLTGTMPETREGYTLPKTWAGEGVHEEIAARVSGILEQDREAFMDVCHACKLTDIQAVALFDSLGKALAGGIGQDNSAYNTRLTETVNRLWPQNTARNVDVARRGARFLKIGNELDAEGLSAHPLVLRMAHAVGSMLGEDAMRAAGGDKGALPVGAAAREEMIRVIRSDAYRRNDPAAVRKVEALAARVTR